MPSKEFDECGVGGALNEYYCTNSSNGDYVYYQCPDGCNGGACIKKGTSIKEGTKTI